MRRGTAARLAAMLLVAAVVAGCAAGRAFNRGNDAARAGEWDIAVSQYREALDRDPENAQYRVAFQRAMMNAALHYTEQGRIAEARGQLEDAVRAYRRANDFDLTNRALAAKVVQLERQLRDRTEGAARPAVTAAQPQAPLPGGPAPLVRFTEIMPAFDFTDATVRDILTTIGMAAGINVTFERDYTEPRPQGYSVQMDGVTLEQALNQVVVANGLFYKVLNARTIMIINDTQAKRLAHDEQVLKVLRLSHADANEVMNMIQTLIRIPGATQVQFQVFANKAQNTITVRAPASVAAVIERAVAMSDTPPAEIVIDVEILEVNRQRVKQYGLDLGNYTIGVVFSPEVDPRGDGTLVPPAINLASVPGISSSDFYLSLPAAAVRFLESDSSTKLLAKPQLRGAEGERITLNLGDEVPIPTTVFTPLAQGGANFNPLSSFEYRTVGIILEMTPRVTYGDEIVLELIVENSTRGQNVLIGGTSLPTFSTRRVESKLRLRDGESNLLAGLIRENDRRLLTGFPGILRLPVIRQLFSANDTTIEETDIIMLLTPRIIRTKEITAADLEALFIGTAMNMSLGGAPPLVVEPSAPPAAPDPAPEAPAAPQPLAAPQPPGGQGALAPAPGVPGASGSPVGQVVLTPASSDLQVGSNGITVPISITDVSRLSSVALTVTYNPATLRVRSVQQGSFMSTGGSAVAFTEDHSNPGRIDIVIMRTGDTTGAAGTGLLAALLFDAVGAGQAALSVHGSASAPGGTALPLQFAPVSPVTVR